MNKVEKEGKMHLYLVMYEHQPMEQNHLVYDIVTVAACDFKPTI